ncbi:MAG: HlyD family efflux transporter periplasmic adaptor subunit [Clostridia bacterium]|nr:HlyD family efflux transporter periplasmic adaptor subunit [Clostridia bacterium]
MLTIQVASAESATMRGSVVSTSPEYVLSTIGGTVEKVFVEAGDRVEVGQALCLLHTSVVYAGEDGTVHYFGEVGDTVDRIAERFGAVAVIEPEQSLSISASTQRAYDQNENKIVHPGEKVFLRSTSDTSRDGEGMVTKVDGMSYTVEVLDGTFNLNENVNVHRKSDFSNDSRIGMGSVSRTALGQYTGSGSLVSFLQEDGAKVKKGDPLFETLEGTFDGYVMTGKEILCTAGGIAATLNVTEGTTIGKNAVLLEVWPDDAMRLEARVSENDLSLVKVGGKVTVEFDAMYNRIYGATVEKISMKSDSTSADEAFYPVTLVLDDTSGIRYGMHATVTVTDE